MYAAHSRSSSGAHRTHALEQPPPRRVLELGAGLGLPGLELAARAGDAVTLSDSREALLGQLRREAAALQPELDAAGGAIDVLELDWLDPARVAEAAAKGYDLVIGSDICYANSAPDVARLAGAISQLGAPTTLLAAPAGRDAFGLLQSMLEKSGD